MIKFARRMLKSAFVATISLLILLATSCQPGSEKRSASQPPPQAQAPTLQPQAQPKPAQTISQVPAPAPPPKPDPVAEWIAQVDRQYQRGQSEYRAGHLESAKANFDKAVDMLLQAPLDIRSDDRLQNEFDKIIDGVNQLEMVALKEGDGFTEQPTVPAPITEANQVTFPVDPNIKAQAEQQVKETVSDLPLVVNDYVASYINYFNTNGRSVLERALVRAGRYRDLIQKTFKAEGVPVDLMYLAQAESGFEPLALNPSGARGMWQFMSSRASGYGLQRSWWIDERQDPVKATRAAARHLKDLYNQFGDWYLAMAAYDSGPGVVQQAVRRTGYADFWELYKRDVLPKETKNYVPIILAYAIMSKNASQYGLDKLQVDLPLETDTVRVDYPVDLRLVAECIDVPVERLVELNPSLLRLTTPKDSNFDLRLPAGTKDKYVAAVAAIPADKRVSWRYHKVETGETLDGIARKYHTTPWSIAEANNLQNNELLAEAKLIIPVNPGRTAASGQSMKFSRKPTRHVVKRGETVMSIADDFGVPPERLRRWNHLKGNQVTRGKVLVIYRPVSGEGSTTINSPMVSHYQAKKRRHSSGKGKSSAKSSSKASKGKVASTQTHSSMQKKSSDSKSRDTAALR